MDALGDGTRMAIFQKLAHGPMAVHELAAVVPVSRPAVSQHLRVLKDAGLIRDSRDGTRRMYQLDPAGIARLRAHLDRVWDKALGAFQTAAEEAAEKEAPHRSAIGNQRRTQRETQTGTQTGSQTGTKTGEKDDRTRRKRRRS
jgi:DNA-binding transcriptional ArsR family regulator